MKRIAAIFIALYLLLGGIAAQGQLQYSVRHYSVVDGLSQNTVMAILQDRDGFMWFGTWDGLNRFDGYDFKIYKPTFYGEQLSSNRIDYLYEDSLGFIWMRTYGGSFYRLNKHTEQIYATNIHDTRFGNQRPEKILFQESKAGHIWLAGNNSLIHIEEQEGYDGVNTQQSVYTLVSDAAFIITQGDAIWVGTDKGLEYVEDGQKTTFLPSSKPEESQFTAGFCDKKNLWFGTESGLIWRYLPRGNRFERVDIGLNSPVTNIAKIDDNLLIITSAADGFAIYNIHNGQTTIHNSGNTPHIQSNYFSNLYIDSHKEVWMVNRDKGVLRYCPNTQEIKRYTSNIDERYNHQLDPNFIAFEDAQGHLLINPQGGGFAYYNPQKDCLESNWGGVTNMIHYAYADKGGALWLGTYDLGIDYVRCIPQQFKLYDLRQDIQHSGEPRAMMQMQNGDILIGTKDKKVRLYDKNMELKETLPLHSRVYSMQPTADGSIWFGTKGDGLFLYKDGYMTNYHSTSNHYSLLCNDIYDLCYGTDSVLYVATFGGGINILRNGRFIHEENDWVAYPNQFGSKVRALMFVNDSTLFAATTSGLLRVNTKTLETRQTPYFDIRAFHQTKDGHVWIGTFGGGLVEVFDPLKQDVFSEDNTQIYRCSNGLQSDIILSIVGEPEVGDLWFTCEDGLSHLNLESRYFQHFATIGLERGCVFGEAKGLRLLNGDIMFGYSCGTCVFSPEKIYHLAGTPQLQFTNFLLFNKPVLPSEGGPLPEAISYTPEITLKSSQSVFSIEYAALAFGEAEEIQYAYKMDGVDSEWNYVGSLRHATYTQLRHGTYTFRVRSTNTEGIWSDNERTLIIHIKPSFWLTPWAFLIYLLLLSLLLYGVYRSTKLYTRLQQEVVVEQQVTDIKLRFFTNISHELRTPLTLISGPVENILKNEKISPAVRSQLEIVSSNSERMLRMINQILDFRKIQNKKMRLKIQQTNVKKLVADTCTNFNKEAYDKHINFTIDNEVPDAVLWVDRDKTDTILYNLLSNAFKYTPEGGSITVKVTERKDFVLISVADTGRGIAQERKQQLFERFNSANEQKSITNKPSSGIGLNLVKELVDLHKGYIEVESELGRGSVFTVLFHTGKEHFGNDADMIVDDCGTPDTKDIPQKTLHLDNLSTSDSHYNVLVVDDNEDMCRFLKSILSAHYMVTTATDGADALDKMTVQMPDMIVSDLMMPNLDGLELTDHIKNDPTTSHIPVILLTAKSSIESRLEALKYGADDYITKPFSPEYLLARLENIISQRKRLQETYRKTLLSLEPTQIAEPSPDEAFLAHLLDFMEHHMDNSELAVEDLVREMALGRTVFFNKLKSLTGLSPVEFIREIRIKRAAQLLETGNYNITEITYMVGMNDSRYFAKCFKNAYGVTPTEYRKNLTQSSNS